MLASAQKLAAAGADFLICPDNTILQALPLVVAASPLPWLHIADEVTAEARSRGFACLGVMGTAWLVRSRVYPDCSRGARSGGCPPG
jgi:aspartate racemase